MYIVHVAIVLGGGVGGKSNLVRLNTSLHFDQCDQ